MTKGRAFFSVATAIILASLTTAHAATCGNGPGGFEAWKQQFAPEARAKGIGAAGVSALMGTNYASATIAADRGLKSFNLSLDAFMALLALAPRRVKVHARYPLHVGDAPASLPGIDEVARLAERMPVVATTDPVHHGIGYGDAPGQQRAAAQHIDAQLRALEAHDYAAFVSACKSARSDFRDAGPALAHVIGQARFDVKALELVDYSQALEAASPTWVAGALIRAARPRSATTQVAG